MQEKIIDVSDKGKFSAFTMEISIKDDSSKELSSRVLSTLILRGLGGHGYKGTLKPPSFPKKPERQPDFVAEEKTTPN